MKIRTARSALLALAFISGAVAAQSPNAVDGQTLKLTTTFHGESPPLRELARNPADVAPGNGQLFEFELDELYEVPSDSPSGQVVVPPLLQTFAPKPLAAVAGASFEGPGVGLSGFSLTGAPPDMTLAVGPNHIVAWVNSQYAVFNKSGTLLVAPVNGNTLFTGVGNECATTNRGDPILQYDRLAQRWILSQFAFPVDGSGNPISPYYQCFAISTTNDPTGSYVRYSVLFSGTSPSGFNDYGKLGVWPDGYYTAFNIFGGSPAGGNTGAALCASDRIKMLAGDPTATTLCAPIGFYGGGAGFLPADLDGTTLPSDLTQGGIFMRVSTTNNLRYLKLKPNFAAGTVTLTDGFGGAAGSFINVPIGATTNACNGGGGACVAQPGTATLLDTLGSRLMYRLAYRNRGGVESMMVTHSVDPDGAGGQGAALRWYEIRNPLGNPSDPVVANRPVLFQNGTYNPGASGDRWMGSIAMNQDGNMMMGYSIANAGAGIFPSIGIVGRELGDPVSTLQAEATAFAGSGSQTGTLTRWGDYSTIQVDPSDDRTFWYIGQYLAANGSFNWHSRIVSYSFPVPAATLNINDVTLSEGNSGTTNAQFTITRSNTASAVSVRVDTANGTAAAGSDFVGITNQTVNFTAGGSATAIVNVVINGDSVLEPDETFTVNLSNPTNATIADGSGLGTINNDDAASIAINDVTLAEGNSGTTNFVFTESVTGEGQNGFSVPFSTSNGTATQPGDYASNSGTLNFSGSPGETKTITVAVVGDAILEPNETFNVTLGSPSNPAITVSDGSGLGTINNDDAASIAINDVTLAEGNSGTTNFVFTVSLTGAVQGGFTVPFSTANGSATQPSDYASNSGTLTFTGSANETKTVTVAVVGDTNLEPDEDFTVTLGAASNAAVTVSDGSGLGTISNDDSASIAINDVTLAEGNSGSSNFVFTVTLTGAVSGGFTVPFSTSNGTATQPGDYASNSGTLTFTGSANETKTVTVAVVGETILEPNETFTVNLGAPSNAAVTVSDGSGLGTINNDDAASIAINDVTLAEGNSGTTNFVFTVSLTGAVQAGFTVPFSTSNGTATQPGDYASNSGTLTFTGGANETKTITVAGVGDTILEPVESFTVDLGTSSNAAVTVSDASGLGTINNDDSASIAINNVTLAEGNSGATNFVFTVSLTGTVQGGFTVPFSTADGTATQPGDYASNSGTLTFTGSASETKTITVAAVGDLVAEFDENFFVNLGSATAGVSVSQAQGTGLISNDDFFADITISNSDSVSWVAPGDTTTYAIVVNNTSSIIDVAAVNIAQTLPGLLINVSWTCSGTGGATCPASGIGAVNQTLAMPKGSSLTFLVTATVNSVGGTPPTSVDTSVTATVQSPASDPNTANNTSADSNVLITDIIFRDGFQ